MEVCMKNCGAPVCFLFVFLFIALKIFQFRTVVVNSLFLLDLRVKPELPIKKEKLHELIHVWRSAFPHCLIDNFYNNMKRSGVKFPEPKDSDVPFAEKCAPDWADGKQCFGWVLDSLIQWCWTHFRCESKCGYFINKKDICRACGQSFCGKCCDCQMSLPKFGIPVPVRVCKTCFEKDKNQEKASGAEVCSWKNDILKSTSFRSLTPSMRSIACMTWKFRKKRNSNSPLLSVKVKLNTRWVFVSEYRCNLTFLKLHQPIPFVKSAPDSIPPHSSTESVKPSASIIQNEHKVICICIWLLVTWISEAKLPGSSWSGRHQIIPWSRSSAPCRCSCCIHQFQKYSKVVDQHSWFRSL